MGWVRVVGGVTAGFTTIDRALVAVELAVSVTLAVNAEVPAVAGVPEMTPVVLSRVSPAGSVPEEIDQLSPPAPPVAASVAV